MEAHTPYTDLDVGIDEKSTASQFGIVIIELFSLAQTLEVL
jgi:hypothetical protein